MVFLAVFVAIISPIIVFYLAGPAAALILAAFAGFNVKGVLDGITKYTFEQDYLTQNQKEARLGFIALTSLVSSMVAILGARSVAPADKMEDVFIEMLAKASQLMSELFNFI